ncbi:MAG: hypothetical protein FH756_10915 [Firmicutes bacterium]|nr:hypothetical protein [Bacillota bacterium]
MIKILVAGPPDFINRIQSMTRQSYANDIRIISLNNNPSSAIEALEGNARGAHAVLLGFHDEEIELMIDMATRNEVTGTIFISEENPAKCFRKWTKYRAKVALKGNELKSIFNYFTQYPELISRNTQKETNVFGDEPEDIPEVIRGESDSKARVEMVRLRENQKRGIPVRPKIISIFGQKGGVGKTVISVSMAESLAVLTDLDVAILDLDMNRAYGDVIRYFGNIVEKKDALICSGANNKAPSPQEKTLAAWANFPWDHRANRDTVENYLIKHRKNLCYLPPLRRLAEEEFINYELVQKVISVIHRHFPAIVIDCGNTLSDSVVAAMESSDEIMIVVSPEYPVLDNLSHFATDIVNQLNTADGTVRVVMNEKRDGASLKNTDETIAQITGGYPLIAEFPYDPAVYNKLAQQALVPHLGGELIPFLEVMDKVLKELFPRELFGNDDKEKKGNMFKKFFRFGKKANL